MGAGPHVTAIAYRHSVRSARRGTDGVKPFCFTQPSNTMPRSGPVLPGGLETR